MYLYLVDCDACFEACFEIASADFISFTVNMVDKLTG